MFEREKSGTIDCKLKEEKKDELLRGFKTQEIEVSGEAAATLVFREIEYSRAVLYVHGFADCFYNEELAREYMKQGYSFYGLDLREHGRSIKNAHKKFYVDKIEDYFKEIDAAIYKMLERHNKIVLTGFSMGGLVSSLYMQRGFYRDHIAALLLVSPLFKFSTNIFQDYLLKPLVLSVARIFPFLKYNVNTDKYRDYVSRVALGLDGGRGDVMHKNIPLYFGWFKAMYDGISELEKGLSINKPVLVISSDKSEKNLSKYDFDADILLDVKDMETRSKLLGKDVTYRKIDGATHDVFLSKEVPRKQAYEVVFEWLNINLK